MFKINFRLLRLTKQKGRCLCKFETCPCDNFLEKHVCECLVFQEVKELSRKWGRTYVK
jgi:hypothetical protein